MPTIISYKDSSGSEIGELSLSESVFGLEPNIHVMYEAVKMYRANRRQGTVFVKNRSHVSGTTKKPFRQKGTGRARQGSHKVGHYRGGGAPFGPKPRDYSYSIPKKVKRLALRSALSAKQRDGELVFIDKFEVDQPRTKLARAIFENLDLDGTKTLLVTGTSDRNVYLACRNLPNIRIILAQNLNTYEILNSKVVLLTKEAVEKIEEVFGPK